MEPLFTHLSRFKKWLISIGKFSPVRKLRAAEIAPNNNIPISLEGLRIMRTLNEKSPYTKKSPHLKKIKLPVSVLNQIEVLSDNEEFNFGVDEITYPSAPQKIDRKIVVFKRARPVATQ